MNRSGTALSVLLCSIACWLSAVGSANSKAVDDPWCNACWCCPLSCPEHGEAATAAKASAAEKGVVETGVVENQPAVDSVANAATVNEAKNPDASAEYDYQNWYGRGYTYADADNTDSTTTSDNATTPVATSVATDEASESIEVIGSTETSSGETAICDEAAEYSKYRYYTSCSQETEPAAVESNSAAESPAQLVTESLSTPKGPETADEIAEADVRGTNFGYEYDAANSAPENWATKEAVKSCEPETASSEPSRTEETASAQPAPAQSAENETSGAEYDWYGTEYWTSQKVSETPSETSSSNTSDPACPAGTGVTTSTATIEVPAESEAPVATETPVASEAPASTASDMPAEEEFDENAEMFEDWTAEETTEVEESEGDACEASPAVTETPAAVSEAAPEKITETTETTEASNSTDLYQSNAAAIVTEDAICPSEVTAVATPSENQNEIGGARDLGSEEPSTVSYGEPANAGLNTDESADSDEMIAEENCDDEMYDDESYESETEAPDLATETTPVAAETPVVTETPAVTETPVATEAPAATETPVATEAPAEVPAPTATETPAATEMTEVTETHASACEPACETENHSISEPIDPVLPDPQAATSLYNRLQERLLESAERAISNVRRQFAEVADQLQYISITASADPIQD